MTPPVSKQFAPSDNLNELGTLPRSSSKYVDSSCPQNGPDLDCQQCLAFLKRSLDRSGRPQSLLRALGVISHGTSSDKEQLGLGWYSLTENERGVVINLAEPGAPRERKSSQPLVRQMSPDDPNHKSTRQYNVKSRNNDVSPMKKFITARIGGYTQDTCNEDADVLTTSPTFKSSLSAESKSNVLVKESQNITVTIECQKCGFDTRAEAGARAYVKGPVPLSIVLCSNRLTSQREVDEVLVHELIHIYDVHSRQMDLRDCRQLAYSEVRAARDAECSNSITSFTANICAKDKATVATKNMFPDDGRKCVCDVFDKAIKDFSPFNVDQKYHESSVMGWSKSGEKSHSSSFSSTSCQLPKVEISPSER